jgi:hypothetical protein
MSRRRIHRAQGPIERTGEEVQKLTGSLRGVPSEFL